MQALIKLLFWHVMPLQIWPAVIAAGASIAGSMISANNSGGLSSARQGSYRTEDRQERDLERQRQDTALQRTVADARTAGLHPLFALGGPGAAGSSVSKHAGYASGGGSGSAIGAGITRAGQEIARGLSRKQQAPLIAAEESRRQELHDAAMRQNTHQDFLDQMERASILKRAEGNANTGPRMNEDGSVVVPSPYAETINPLPQNRPTRQEPNVNAPLFTTLINRAGEKFKIFHESAQADELNQILLGFQVSAREGFKIAEHLGFGVFAKAGQNAYKIVRKRHPKGASTRAPTRKYRKSSGGGW